MPVSVLKLPGKNRYQVKEKKKGGKVYAKSTTKAKAEAQARILNRIGYGKKKSK